MLLVFSRSDFAITVERKKKKTILCIHDERREQQEDKCVCFMLYVILILSIDVMNVGSLLFVIIRARFLPPLLNSLSFEAFFPSLSSFSHFFRAHFYDFLLLPMLLMLLLCGAFLSELSSNVFFSFFSFTFLGFFDMEKL